MPESEEAKARRSARSKEKRMARAEAEGRPYIEKGGKGGRGRAPRVLWTPGSSITVPENDPL